MRTVAGSLSWVLSTDCGLTMDKSNFAQIILSKLNLGESIKPVKSLIRPLVVSAVFMLALFLLKSQEAVVEIHQGAPLWALSSGLVLAFLLHYGRINLKHLAKI